MAWGIGEAKGHNHLLKMYVVVAKIGVPLVTLLDTNKI
jgi:hypothetical protein